MSVDAVVLGGGDGTEIDPGCRFKGLLDIGGSPMIEYVIDALRAADHVDRVIAVVPEEDDLGPWMAKVDEVVVVSGTLMESVLSGAAAVEADRPALLVTGDIPLLRGSEIDDFVRDALNTGAEIVYPVIRKEHMLGQFPTGVRTFIKLREGEVTGGNMLLVIPELLERNRDLGRSLFEARKNPVQMARILGPGFALQLVRGRLDIEQIEAKMSRLLGGPASALFTLHASIGMDVDKPSDAELVAAELARSNDA